MPETWAQMWRLTRSRWAGRETPIKERDKALGDFQQMTRSLAVESTDINDVFPHKVCINLDRRSKRWEEAQKEFARHEIKSVQRFSAVDGNKLIALRHWRDQRAPTGVCLATCKS